jgi:NitT/TauT family transport system substrate-binding protein
MCSHSAQRRRTAAVALAIAAVALSACGGPSGKAPKGKDGRDQVTVGVIPIVDVAPIYLGKDKGFFKKRGIDLKLQAGSGGAATVPGVVSGQFQFGFGNVTSLIVARDKDLPLRAIANGVNSTGERGHDFAAIVVPKDSPITSPKDLSGKTVAVNNLQNIGDTSVRASVRRAGGDPKGVKFVELAFPDMGAALEKHRIDAAWVVEPFLGQARKAGARVVAWNLEDVAPDLTVAAYFTHTKVARVSPGLVKRFEQAMNESLEYASAHPDEVRKELGTYTKIPPEAAQKLTLPKWPTKINDQSVVAVAKLARQDGLIKHEFDPGKLLP